MSLRIVLVGFLESDAAALNLSALKVRSSVSDVEKGSKSVDGTNARGIRCNNLSRSVCHKRRGCDTRESKNPEESANDFRERAERCRALNF